MSSFAIAFRDIFASIFKSPVKPRLSRINGLWYCESEGGLLGYGETPARAYGAWWEASNQGAEMGAAK